MTYFLFAGEETCQWPEVIMVLGMFAFLAFFFWLLMR